MAGGQDAHTQMISQDEIKVSVIIPCYNCAAYVREAIDSVLNQTYRKFELIVINDGSTDDSKKILAGYGDAIKVISQHNMGLSSARNAGVHASRGSYLAFLDADDFWDKEFLEVMTAEIERTHAALAYCGWQNTGLTGGRGTPFIPPDYAAAPDMHELLFTNTRWPVHAALVHADFIRDIGGFDPRWVVCEDFAIWLEIAMIHPIVRIPRVLAFYRHHGNDQLTSNRAAIVEYRWRVQRDFLKRHPDLRARIGAANLSLIMKEQLKRAAYRCHWDEDWGCARRLFRLAMRAGYGSWHDLKYILPSMLPLPVHKLILRTSNRMKRRDPGAGRP
jgi:glycosyltransferase involved in cell wall biosynthesis